MRNGNIPKLKRPVKLCVITQFYPPDYAATGQLIEELALWLAQQGMQIKIFTGQPGYAFQKNSAPPLQRSDQILVRRSRTSQMWPQRIRGKALNGLLFCLRSGLHLLRNSFKGDLLLLTTAPPYLPFLGYLVNRIFGLPYVCLLYDLYPDVAIELKVVSEQNGLARLWNWCNQLAWQRAEGIIVLSSTMKDRIVAKCPEVADKIAVIHSWANPRWITPIPKPENWFAKEHGLVDQFTVLYSGNMGRCHDMDTILHAARQLKDEPIRFVFIGSGAKRQICMDQVNAWGLTNCQFLPYQEKKVLPYSLTACDLSLVSIDVGMEGLIAPSKFYGSLAAGRPVAVICESHSYLRQILADAGCGTAFQGGDSTGLANFILHLANNPQVGHQMGLAGRKYLESHFTPEIIAEQYLKFLTSRVPGQVMRDLVNADLTNNEVADALAPDASLPSPSTPEADSSSSFPRLAK